MIFALVIAAVLDWDSRLWQQGHDPLETNRSVRTEWRAQYAEYLGKTNLAERIHNPRRRPKRKERKDMTPVEAFRAFCRGQEVKFGRDVRPAPFKKEEPDHTKRKPRK